MPQLSLPTVTTPSAAVCHHNLSRRASAARHRRWLRHKMLRHNPTPSSTPSLSTSQIVCGRRKPSVRAVVGGAWGNSLDGRLPEPEWKLGGSTVGGEEDARR
ncbi:eukaryotic aspartyl protease family protein [Striga asiatica]|uniref:Eukaryotic aspartyl protease family protein n=1 Tax=Striga asiatica TaxID=4170 RepID=A0A5A7QMV3_STRAF|nr:eukaryotic aspartyl protease family protein [Striga asiatica]